MYVHGNGFNRSHFNGAISQTVKNLLPTALIALGTMLAVAGMCQVKSERIVLRDSSEALSFIQDLTSLLGMILPK